MVNLSAANKARIEASAQYVETHEVYQLFEELLADLLVQKPADPLSHLIEALKKDRPPRVIITGPPAADTRSQCELISSRIGLVHVYGPDLARDSANAGSALGLKAKGVADSSTTGEIPDDLMLDLLKEKLNSEECLSNGYVLEGYPNTAMQARAMLAAGLLPSRVLVLQLDDEEVKRRLDGRRVDNANNKVYHLTDAPPPAGADVVHREDDKPEQVELRLAAYRQAAAAVLPHFRKVLRELDGTLKKEVLYRVVDPLITPEMPSRAPRGCARVVLLGGPGARSEEVGGTPAATPAAPLLALATPLRRPCGAPAAPLPHPLSCATHTLGCATRPLGCATPPWLRPSQPRPPSHALCTGPQIGEELAATYGNVLVSAPALLHALSLKPGSVDGAKVKPYLELGQASMVPDAIINPLVLERLQQEDVRTYGFVLQGYPNSSKQAAWLKKHGVWVRHAVHLEMSNDAAKRRVKGLQVDPADGKQYHPDGEWPSDPAIQARLQHYPNSDDKSVKKALKKWRDLSPQLFKHYAHCMHVCDASGEMRAVVEQLAPCFLIKA